MLYDIFNAFSVDLSANVPLPERSYPGDRAVNTDWDRRVLVADGHGGWIRESDRVEDARDARIAQARAAIAKIPAITNRAGARLSVDTDGFVVADDGADAGALFASAPAEWRERVTAARKALLSA
jgi:hypothetical protein